MKTDISNLREKIPFGLPKNTAPPLILWMINNGCDYVAVKRESFEDLTACDL